MKDDASGWNTYHQATRTATYGFLSVLPLLLLYEVLILLVNRNDGMQVRVGAEVWMKQLLAMAGIGEHIVLFGAVLLVGLGIFVYERKEKIPIRPRYFGGIITESLLYAFCVALLVAEAVGLIFAVAPGVLGSVAPQMALQSPMQLVLSLGAGLYEELLFRVVLVGGLFFVLKKLGAERKLAYGLAALIGALLFSAVHYIGMLGDVFVLDTFVFRFLFGLALNVLFLVRGFGVAAWTHALYDIMVVTGLLG